MSQAATWSLNCEIDTGRVLMIEFAPAGPQLAHTLSLYDGEELLDRWSSTEAMDSNGWPVSPPVQEIQPQAINNVLLAVGRAGASHWSMSVHVEAHQPALIFDVACRVKSKPGHLGSAYRRDFAVGSPMLTIEPFGEIYSEIGETASDQLAITPSDLPTSWPATVRWQYRVTVRR